MTTTNPTTHRADGMNRDEMQNYLEGVDRSRVFTQSGQDGRLLVAEVPDDTGTSTLSLVRQWEGDSYEERVYLRGEDVRELRDFLTYLDEEWPEGVAIEEDLTETLTVDYDPAKHKTPRGKLTILSTQYPDGERNFPPSMCLIGHTEINALRAFLQRGDW